MTTAQSSHIVVVGMGDYRVAKVSASRITTYSLGSCVGVTVYDPVAKVGGMLHAMLPTSSINPQANSVELKRYVDTGLTGLLRGVIAFGGQKERFQIKLAGGGQFLDAKRIFRIGEQNVAAVRSFLSRYDFPLMAEHVGGTQPRTMILHLETGEVTLTLGNFEEVSL